MEAVFVNQTTHAIPRRRNLWTKKQKHLSSAASYLNEAIISLRAAAREVDAAEVDPKLRADIIVQTDGVRDSAERLTTHTEASQ